MAERSRRRRRDWGSVRERVKGGRKVWQVRYTGTDGRRHSGGTFATEALAKAELLRVGRALDAGEFVEPTSGRQRFSDVAAEWQKTIVDRYPSTRAAYDSVLRSLIVPAFGDVPINKITRQQIKQWVAQLVESGYKPEYIRRNLQVLRMVLQEAVEDRALSSNPAANVSTPPIERPQRRALTPAEIKTLVASIDPRYNAAVELMAYCGLRPSELWALRRRDVDLLAKVKTVSVDKGMVEVRGHLTHGPPKTKAGVRKVPLPENVVSAVGAHLETYTGAGADAYVFTTDQGRPVRLNNFRRRIFQPACVRAGLGEWVSADGKAWQPICDDCSGTITDKRRQYCEHGRVQRYVGFDFYELRHTAVSLWAELGAQPRQIMDWAGHKDERTALRIYTHVHTEANERLSAALADAARNAHALVDADVTSLGNART